MTRKYSETELYGELQKRNLKIQEYEKYIIKLKDKLSVQTR